MPNAGCVRRGGSATKEGHSRVMLSGTWFGERLSGFIGRCLAQAQGTLVAQQTIIVKGKCI